MASEGTRPQEASEDQSWTSFWLGRPGCGVPEAARGGVAGLSAWDPGGLCPCDPTFGCCWVVS